MPAHLKTGVPSHSYFLSMKIRCTQLRTWAWMLIAAFTLVIVGKDLHIALAHHTDTTVSHNCTANKMQKYSSSEGHKPEVHFHAAEHNNAACAICDFDFFFSEAPDLFISATELHFVESPFHKGVEACVYQEIHEVNAHSPPSVR